MSSTQAMDDLLDTVRALWPQADVQLRRHGSRTPCARAWFVVPHRRAPRLLVPASGRRAGATSLWRFSDALPARDTLTRTVGALAVASRFRRAVPDLVCVDNEDRSIAAHLQEALGGPVRLSLGIGSARANRKPVLEIFDERGHSTGFAKVGATDVAAQRVRHEIAALQRLGDVRLGQLKVPSTIQAGDWSGMPMLVMSTLPASPWRRPGGEWRIPLSAMANLQVAFGQRHAPLTELPFWQRLTDTADGLQIAPHHERFGAALQRLAERDGDRAHLNTAWHGDWTPWNTARSGHDTHVWDWERFEEGVPPGLDRCHWAVNTMTRAHGLSEARVAEGLTMAAAARGSVAAQQGGDPAGAAYLAAITGRYLASVEEAGGELIQQRALVMLASLEAHLTRS